ncbi:MAG: hypothetical protein RJA10_2727 [Pseudomonadota bacterium]|jgi:hypothetical protein
MQTVVAMREAKAPATDTNVAPPPEAALATPAAPARTRTAFVPLLLGLLAVTAWMAHHAWLLEKDRQQLQAAQATLQPTVEKAAGLRQSLDRLAADTQRLADAGNGNARVLVDELRKRGITINTAATAGPAPTAAAAAPTPAGR